MPFPCRQCNTITIEKALSSKYMVREHVLAYQELIFSRSREKRSLLASADAKGDVYRDRFNLIRQRVLRNENFLPPSLQIIDNDSYLKVWNGLNDVWLKCDLSNMCSRSHLSNRLLAMTMNNFFYWACLPKLRKASCFWKIMMPMLNWIYLDA